jgi:hypothetical protein
MTALLSALDSLPRWALVGVVVYFGICGVVIATAWWCNRDDLAREVDEPRKAAREAFARPLPEQGARLRSGNGTVR